MKEGKESSNNKRTILLVVIAVIALIAIVGGATFAFFATARDIEPSLPVNTQTATSTFSFSASSDGDISFSITAQDMAEANINSSYIISDSGNVNIELASAKDNELTICTYDIVWVWDSNDTYTKADVDDLPYEIGDKTYPYELSVTVDGENETDLSDLTWADNKAIVASGLKTTAVSTSSVSNTHRVEVKAYNIPVKQDNLFNKSFQAHLKVENVECYSESIEKNVLSYDNIYTSLLGNSNKKTNFIDTDNTIYSGIIKSEKGLRFEGSNPNNYVLFNDELWRIIGVFDEETHGRSGEQLAKLVRSESLPHYYQWDNSEGWGSNNWNTALINTNLNVNYYNNNDLSACTDYSINYEDRNCTSVVVKNQGIKNDTARNMIQPIKWKLGALGIGGNAETFYKYERGTLKGAGTDSTLESNDELPIGLIYVSDYLYAVKEENCSRSLTSYRNNSNCYSKNWLYNSLGSYWTITPHLNEPSYAFDVSSNGSYSSSVVKEKHILFPTIYLKSTAKIISGQGTIINPYQIEIG